MYIVIEDALKIPSSTLHEISSMKVNCFTPTKNLEKQKYEIELTTIVLGLTDLNTNFQSLLEHVKD